MNTDIAGPRYRSLVVGLNEFAGYLAVSMTALLSGYIASTYSVRPQPFYLGIVYAFIGLTISVFFIKNTTVDTGPEEETLVRLSLVRVFAISTWGHKKLFSTSHAGFMTDFKDGMAWGLFTLFFRTEDRLSVR